MSPSARSRNPATQAPNHNPGIRELAQQYFDTRALLSPAHRIFSALPHTSALVAWGITAVLFIAGGLLLLKPLTAVLVAFYFWIAATAWLLFTVLRTTKHRLARTLVIVGFVALAAIVVGSAYTLNTLPAVGASLLFVGALARIMTLKKKTPAQKILRLSVAAMYVLVGASSMFWPDITLVVMGYIFALWLIITSFRVSSRILKGEVATGHQPAEATPSTPHNSKNIAPLIGAFAVGLSLIFVGMTVAGATMWLRSTFNQVDSFYSYDTTNLPEPGTLLRIGAYNGNVPENLLAKRMLYTTTGTSGQTTVASGIIAIPADMTEADKPHMLLWEHSTTGLAPACSPSAGSTALSAQNIPAFVDVYKENWGFVAPDLTSFEQTRATPFLIGETQAAYSLDAARAARTLTLADITSTEDTIDAPAQGSDLFSPETVVWGHSQGGHAALWTAKHASSYAPELTISGVAALAPIAEPFEFTQSLIDTKQSSVAMMLSYIVDSYSSAYDDVTEQDYVRFGASPIVNSLDSRCTDSSSLASAMSMILLGAEGTNLYSGIDESSTLGQRLTQNAAVGTFDVPVFYGWGTQDEVVTPQLHEKYGEQLCTANPTATINTYVDDTHLDVLRNPQALATSPHGAKTG
ncbi:lipase family protein [Timonella sp. A28]|uniref:lipase family protein n=1 Tax=Timonella sp. A28 TaxID=3442640 RepID=UPI003EC1023B